MFATRVRTRRRSFATARPIAKLKPPLCSVESKLPIGVKIPFSTKCGKWVIYAEPVTNVSIFVLYGVPIFYRCKRDVVAVMGAYIHGALIFYGTVLIILILWYINVNACK